MKKKIVRVMIYDDAETGWFYWIGYNDFGYKIETDHLVRLRSSAIRNARQFFKKLGYKIEVI